MKFIKVYLGFVIFEARSKKISIENCIDNVNNIHLVKDRKKVASFCNSIPQQNTGHGEKGYNRSNVSTSFARKS